jgi:predicted transposase/invertase (TIGR01784 family)
VIKTHHEDITLKCITDFFKEGAAEFFGVKEKILYPLETEINYLEQRQLFADLVFMAENDTIIHFEFQSTNSSKDLCRFCLTDSFLWDEYNRGGGGKKAENIETYVIYTSNIKKAATEFSTKSLKYSITPFYMCDFDGDEKYEKLSEKIKNGEKLTDEDLYSLTLLPLMKTKSGRAEMVEKAVYLGKDVTDEHAQSKVLGALSLLAGKFVKDKETLEKIGRLIKMTGIGKMLWEEGVEEGREAGRKVGRKEGALSSSAKTALRMYRGGMSVREIAKWLGVTVKEVECMLHLEPV